MKDFDIKESPLDSLLLAYPCPIDWATMKGDERKRFCSKCSQNVYNISDLPKQEAEEFLIEQLDKEKIPCLSFYVRPDGTIKTRDCAKWFKPIKQKINWIRNIASILVAFLLSSIGFSNQAKSQGARFGFPPNKWTQHRYRNMINKKSSDKEEQTLLNTLKQKAKSQRTIDRESLAKLRELHQEKGCPIMVFRVMLMEHLTDHYSPEHLRHSQKELTELEEARQKALEQLANEIETGKYKDAYAVLVEFMDIATSGKELIEQTEKFPDGVKKLKVLSGPLKGMPFIISRNLLIRVSNVVSRLAKSPQAKQYINDLAKIKDIEFCNQ